MNSKIYSQPPKEIAVFGEYDVIVVGGGPSGCAAAISAARYGMNTLLIESYGYLGGAVVSQGVTVVLSSNGVDFQGIWHEYMNGLLKRKGIYEDDLKVGYSHINATVDPEITKHVWEEICIESGVNILYHTAVTDVISENNALCGVVVSGKSGVMAAYGKRIIDCTGDGIVAHYAGNCWEQGANGNKYAMATTKVMRLGNIPLGAGPKNEEEKHQIRKNWELAIERGDYTHPIITTGRVLNYINVNKLAWTMPRHRNEVMLVHSRVLKVNPLDPKSVSEAETEGRKQMWEVADFYKKYVPGCENCYIVETSAHLGVRSSRRILGMNTATEDDAKNFNKYPDGIAKSSWVIDVWPADHYTAPAVDKTSDEAKARAERLKKGDYFDIRYGCIVANDVDNLLMAGRIVSAEHLAQSSLRIQQTCMSTGQASGTAAALSIKNDKTPRELDPMIVVEALERDRKSTKPAFALIDTLLKKYKSGGSIE